MSEIAIPHCAQPTPPLIVTLSGGVSSWQPGSSALVPELLNEADEALFEAKSEGRNRVHVADQPSRELDL